MAYNQRQLDEYRQLIAQGKPFKSVTCPYCNGHRDPTVKHLHPSTKPSSAWSFWNDVLIRKYAALQSSNARANMALSLDNPTDNINERKSAAPRMFVVGPMVDQSELPFRMLCRQYGSTLAYTPMLHAKSFAEGAAYRQHFLSTTPAEEVKAAMEKAGGEPGGNAMPVASADAESVAADARLVDRPCIVQFCGHDPNTVLAAARWAVLGRGTTESNEGGGDGAASPTYPVRVRVPNKSACAYADSEGSTVPEEDMEEHLLFGCDAVDLNLGCPQGIARRGHYGSFLMEDWELIHTIIHTLHVELEVPVTAKIRVFDHPGYSDDVSAETPLKKDFDEALTILYARMIRDAGAQVLCIHGRTREMKGQLTSVANMELIRRVRQALHGSIPVIANGNVYTYDDVIQNLRATQCEGHMCAEPLLWDPALLSHPRHPVMPGRTHGADKVTRLAALRTAQVYMAWVRRCPVDVGFVKAHLFKMCFHSYELHTEYRESLAQLKTSVSAMQAYEDGEEGMAQEKPLVQPPLAAVKRSNAASVEQEDVPFVESNSTSFTTFEHYIDAIDAHLQQLMEAEKQCSVGGEQPKTAQAEKAKAKQEVVDVWEDEGGLGINF